jgi:hypothetical protein
MEQLSKHGAAWSSEDMAKLNSMAAKGTDICEMAKELGRTEASVVAKSAKLRAVPVGTRPRSQRRRNGALFFLS